MKHDTRIKLMNELSVLLGLLKDKDYKMTGLDIELIDRVYRAIELDDKLNYSRGRGQRLKEYHKRKEVKNE